MSIYDEITPMIPKDEAIAYVEAAVLAEREACVKVIENAYIEPEAARTIAEAIRSRCSHESKE